MTKHSFSKRGHMCSDLEPSQALEKSHWHTHHLLPFFSGSAKIAEGLQVMSLL